MCPCCGFSSCPQVTIELYNKLHKSLQAATTTRQQYGDNSCLWFARLFGFFIHLCATFGCKLSMARGPKLLVSKMDIGKSMKCNCNKSSSSGTGRPRVQLLGGSFKAVDANTRLLSFAGQWRNLSSASHLVSANERGQNALLINLPPFFYYTHKMWKRSLWHWLGM